MTGLIIFLLTIILLAWLILRKKRLRKYKPGLPVNYRELLNENVDYYRSLNDTAKVSFEQKIKDFLSYVNIHGVNINVEELDKLLVASSAVIPIFGFDNWHYYNLKTVLLYEDTFDAEDYSTTSDDRNILGMVGTGHLQQMMILSKPALLAGFQNKFGTSNTGIHEFVHLLDKADGATDGVPEQLLSKQHTLPWINLMNKKIEEIRAGQSDINPYASTGRTEFFAVAAEYFFQRPYLFKQNHPELSAMLEQIFQQRTG